MKTQLQRKLNRALSFTVITTVVAFIALGGFLIHAASKKRVFNGRIQVKVCKKLPNGQWQEIDKGEGALNFEASLIETATSKEFTSNHVWSSTSAKGKSFSSRLQGAGKVNADLVAGRFDVTSLPMRLTLDGQPVLAQFSLTTESVNVPNGEALSGKRARIVNQQGDIALVGFSKPVVVNHEEQFAGNKQLVDKKKLTEELIFILRAEGKIAAK